VILPPGRTLAPPSLFTIARSGAAISATTADAVLSPGTGSGPLRWLSWIVAVFTILSRPALTVPLTVTAKMNLPLPPVGTARIVLVHCVPAGLPAAHDQPLLLWRALKVVPAGTFSLMMTPAVAWLPTFR
jgi:hypothetical protein